MVKGWLHVSCSSEMDGVGLEGNFFHWFQEVKYFTHPLISSLLFSSSQELSKNSVIVSPPVLILGCHKNLVNKQLNSFYFNKPIPQQF